MADAKGSASQLDAFRALARELGCDGSEERFDEALRKIGKAKAAATDGSTPIPDEETGRPLRKQRKAST